MEEILIFSVISFFFGMLASSYFSVTKFDDSFIISREVVWTLILIVSVVSYLVLTLVAYYVISHSILHKLLLILSVMCCSSVYLVGYCFVRRFFISADRDH